MDKPLRESLAQSVCNKLQEAIQNNTWQHVLPGIRALSEEMKVSKQTMMQALQLLEKSGYVEQVSPGKPRKITKRNSSKNPNHKIATVIGIISFLPSSQLSYTDQKIHQTLSKLLIKQGLEPKEIVFKDLLIEAGARKIESIVKQNPSDVYVIMGASPACKKVLRTLELPIIYMGGEAVDGCVPIVAFSIDEICAKAVDHLAALGHRKITVMLSSIFNRKTKRATAAEAKVKKIFDVRNIPFSTYNCPRWGKTKSDFYDTLESLFETTPPTALILGDTGFIPRVVSFLLKQEMHYPDDLSIIVLDEDEYLKEYRPTFCHIEKPTASLVKETLNVIKKLLIDPHYVGDGASVPKTKLVINESVRAIETI